MALAVRTPRTLSGGLSSVLGSSGLLQILSLQMGLGKQLPP